MICRVDETVYRGRAVDLQGAVSPATLATAIRQGEASEGDRAVAVTCKRPHPVHERVGCIEPDMWLRPRTALAEAGRARGLGTPVDDALAERQAALAALAVETPTTADARQDVAATAAETDRLRERVAAARGRLQARREAGANPGDAADDLAAAVGALSEVETEAAAARERQERVRSTAREARDRLEDRLRLEDEVGNLEREVRATLVERLRPAYEAALAAVPGVEAPDDAFAAPPDAMALAVARVARLDAPVVLASERFETANAAAQWLGSPVLRCSP